jgi:hypothetical protein
MSSNLLRQRIAGTKLPASGPGSGQVLGPVYGQGGDPDLRLPQRSF